MIVDLAPGFLTWDEVDPSRHPFDLSSAARVVGSLGPAQRVPRRPDVSVADRAMRAWAKGEAEPWANAMSHALAERYGRWALGWRWARDEGDFDGGPVAGWCCPRDSVTTPEETLDRVVAALCEWREWIESLAGWFDAYPLEPATGMDQRVLWEQAARNLINQVVDRTGCGSGWYAHCRLVLTWFLCRWHVERDVAEDLVGQAIGGRFHSWISPDSVEVDDVAERLATSVRPASAPRPSGPAPDYLERWLVVRGSTPWQDAADRSSGGPVAPVRDGAAEDIRAFDGSIDPARARRLLTALDLVRSDALRDAPLTFERLRAWQQHVLGAAQPPLFRNSVAFAKGGRERYGIGPDTLARLDACLAESAGDSRRPLPLTARAARAYLDVCFFHPFENGNARAAFLTLVFVLAREDVALDNVSLLRRVSFQADDQQDPMTLIRYLNIHLTETRRNLTSRDLTPE